jgi:Zn-dependent peptidase ImmA (M78 family)
MKVLMPLKFHHKLSVRAFVSTLSILLMISAGFAVEQSILHTQDLVVYDAGLESTGRQAAEEYPAIKQELETLFQWSLDLRPTLVLLKDNKRFRNLAGDNLVVAYALPNKNVVVIDHSKMNTSPFMLRNTFKHELCHLLLHHYIRDDNLPRWLDEGICQWASDGFADIIMDTKRNLLPTAILSDTYFDLEKLQHQFPQDKNSLMLAYQQSKSVVEYLSSKYGSQGILDFLKLLQQGYDLESAFEFRFAMPIDEFQYQWRGHLKKNINWFTYVSIHLYEILFVLAALLTILGFVRKMVRRRAYSAQEDEEDAG